jgi:sarcosine oxidase gamma subunit
MACPSLPSGHEAAEAGAIGKVLIDIDGRADRTALTKGCAP